MFICYLKQCVCCMAVLVLGCGCKSKHKNDTCKHFIKKMRDKTAKILFYPAKRNKKILFILLYGPKDRYKDECGRKCKRNDDWAVNSFGIYQYDIAKCCPKQHNANYLCLRQRSSHWAAFFLATMASMTATAVMFTMSRTELSKSVKWMGLFSPICIGPISSMSVFMACRSL